MLQAAIKSLRIVFLSCLFFPRLTRFSAGSACATSSLEKSLSLCITLSASDDYLFPSSLPLDLHPGQADNHILSQSHTHTHTHDCAAWGSCCNAGLINSTLLSIARIDALIHVSYEDRGDLQSSGGKQYTRQDVGNFVWVRIMLCVSCNVKHRQVLQHYGQLRMKNWNWAEWGCGEGGRILARSFWRWS